MEDNHLSVYSDNNIAEKEIKIDFSFILNNLATREKNALKTLAMTTVDAFCEYDFSQLFSVQGYGETTVTRIQALQKRIRKANGHEELDEEPLSLQSHIKCLPLSTKENNALHLLNVTTVSEFLDIDLSELQLPKGYGHITLHCLAKTREWVLRKLSIELPEPVSFWEQSISAYLPLNPRERKTLIEFGISNWWEFACFDFQQIEYIPNIGSGTLQSLSTKQADIREKIIRKKIDSISEFSCDNEFSVFLLDLSFIAKEALWHLGITRISELFYANLAILKSLPSPICKAYKELAQIQKDFSPEILASKGTLNDFLTSTTIKQSGISGNSLMFLQENGVKSLQDFLFFAVPKDNFVLRQLQFERRCRYAPTDFLHGIPPYFSICFYLQKKFQNTREQASYDLFATVKDFLSATSEDIAQLTGGNPSVVCEIQSAQYELIKFCCHFRSNIVISSVVDERIPAWEQTITEESLKAMPFFSNKPLRSVVDSVHKSFLPHFKMDKIIYGKMLSVFKKNGVSTLGGLLLTPMSPFLLIKHFSEKKIARVHARIQKLLLPPPSSPLDKSTPEAFLISLLQNYVRSERAINVLLQRVNGKTLENIAERYGLTRERIRQLELKCKIPADITMVRSPFVEVHQMLESSLLKLEGFAHAKKIATQLAKDNDWSEQNCSHLLVKFLIDRVANFFISYGNGYYSTLTHPCEKCELLAATISNLAKRTNDKVLTRQSLLSNLLKTCCAECDLSQHITESFVDWKCSSDSQYQRITEEGEIYRSTKCSMQKRVYQVLKKASRPLKSDEILAILKRHTENKSFTEKQVRTAACSMSCTDKDIYFWNHGGVYVHRNYIQVNNPLFVQIEKRLKQLIKKANTSYVSLYTLFSEYEAECEKEGIPSVHALHACLKARGIPGIAFMRSPCVSVTDKRHERRNIRILEDWVAQRQSIISYQSLINYAHEIGINPLQVGGNYTKMRSLARYKAGLVVHIRTLGWNQAKQESLLTTASNWWKQCIAQGSLFARTDELLSEFKTKLPTLPDNISWTSSLLFSLLSRSESIVTFGNTHLAYGLKNNDSVPQSLGDIVVEVLKNTFGGRANFSDISSYFRDELHIIRQKLTPKMVRNYPGLITIKDEVCLSENENAS